MTKLVLALAALSGAAGLAPRAQRSTTLQSTADPKDVFGIGNEEAMLGATRPGQDSFDGALDVREADPFGYADEAATRRELAARDGNVNPSEAFGYEASAPSVGVSYEEGVAVPRKMSRALPFAERPAVLDEVALAGDFGFDPFGLADSAERLLWMRDAEVRHARLAMLAAVGWPLSELWHGGLAEATTSPSIVAKLAGDAPSVLNGGLDAVPPTFWVAAVVATVVVELQGLQARANGKLPGDLGWRAGSQIAEKVLGGKRAVADAEFVNGRLAMLAIVGFAAQEFAARLSGIPVPVVAQSFSSAFFHPLF